MERFTHNVGENMISYKDQGIGHCVVLIHGFCGDHNYWKYIVPHLIKQNRVLAIDLRGHGDSSTPKDNFDITDLANDLYSLLSSLKVEKATLIGHSLGGYVSLAFAYKFPNMVSGLSLVHSTAYEDSDEAKQNREKGIQRINEEGIFPFVKDLVPKLFSDSHIEQRPNDINDVSRIGYRTSALGAIGALEAMKTRTERIDVLRNLTVPVLLVAGNEDKLLPVDSVFSVDGSNITHKLLKDCGHMSMFEQPEQLASILGAFLQKITVEKV